MLTEETVHLHLEQRVAQRLLARFRAQGFIHHDLSRACLAQVRDSIPRVILLGRLSLYGQRRRAAARGARASRRALDRAGSRATARSAHTRATPRRRSLELLDDALGGTAPRQPRDAIASRLLRVAPRTTSPSSCLSSSARAEELAAEAEREAARARRAREARCCARRSSASATACARSSTATRGEFQQLTLGFAEEERRQLESNMRSWERRLAQFDRDLDSEPDRIADFYEVRAQRIEPVGLVYLWPDTN